MRWKFPPKNDQSYNAERQDVCRRIDQWWRAFEAKHESLGRVFSGKETWDLPQWMNDNLGAVHRELMWEYGPGLEGGHRLVITPETSRSLRPMVDTLLAQAPTIPGWEFYPYRLRETVDEAHRMLEARKLMPLKQVTVIVTPNSLNQVDLLFISPNFSDNDDSDASNAAFVASEVILGEEILDHWIGFVDVDNDAGHAEMSVELPDLAAAVDRELATIRETLPKNPWWQSLENTDWHLFDIKSSISNNRFNRSDMFVASSASLNMWQSTVSDAIFCSERYSMTGEIFCFVRIDGNKRASDERLRERREFEDSLDRALKIAQAGAVVGNAFGETYSYIDLALSNADIGTEITIDTLRSDGIAQNAWIQFYDDIYAHEWIGLWDDTPPPPRRLTS